MFCIIIMGTMCMYAQCLKGVKSLMIESQQCLNVFCRLQASTLCETINFDYFHKHERIMRMRTCTYNYMTLYTKIGHNYVGIIDFELECFKLFGAHIIKFQIFKSMTFRCIKKLLAACFSLILH